MAPRGEKTLSAAVLAELHRLLFPESNLVSEEEIFGSRGEGKAAISEVRKVCDAKAARLPGWALLTISQICTERDEGVLADYFLKLARKDAAESHFKDAFPETPKKTVKRTLPELSDCTRLDPAEVASFLERGGELSRMVEGYEPRQGQIEMLKSIVGAFNEGRHLVVEAGTGTGKSLAYLLPAAMWASLNDTPVVVSTNTKNLQTQLVEKDLPAVLSMMKARAGNGDAAPLKAAVIKGRMNYLCLRRLSSLLDENIVAMDKSDLRMLAQTIVWACTTGDGDLDSLLGGSSVDMAFAQNLVSSSEECHGRKCKFCRRCFLQHAREKSLDSNLVIANHSLVFSELDAESPVSIPLHSQIVFDEAHNLEEAATRYFSREFTPHSLAVVLRRVVYGRGRTARGLLVQIEKHVDSGVACPREPWRSEIAGELASARASVSEVLERGYELFCAFARIVGPESRDARRYAFSPAESDGGTPYGRLPRTGIEKWDEARERYAEFDTALARLIENLKTIAETIRSSREDELDLGMDDTNDIDGALARLGDLRNDAAMLMSGSNSEYVFWLEGEGASRRQNREPVAGAYAAPLKIGGFLADNLFAAKSSVILSSATLTVGGRFSYMASRLGLDLVDQSRLVTNVTQSPFNYLTQCSLRVPKWLPEPVAQDRSYVEGLADLVARLAAKFNGRTLCLFTSYEMMRECARIVEPKLGEQGITLLVHGESGSRNMLTNVFRKDDRTVLFGTQSFWEGVDVVGEALSCVVIARLPFASPGDPIVSARSEQIEREGGSSFRQYHVPSAVIRLRQGFGRLIRHRNDHGMVVIADTRIVTKGYGSIFKASLPTPLKVCETIDELLDC